MRGLDGTACRYVPNVRGNEKATFSICAVDRARARSAALSQSRYFAVGSVVPWAKAGVGAVATQAAGVAAFGPRTLALLEEGLSPDEALAARARRRRRSARRASSASSRPTGVRRRTPARSASRWAGHRSATATPSRGTSSPARPSSPRWSAPFSRRPGRWPSGSSSSLEAGQARGRRLARAAVRGDRRRAGRRVGASRDGHRPRLRAAGGGPPRADRRAAAAARHPPRVGRGSSRVGLPRAGPYEDGVALLGEALADTGSDAVLLYDLACFESLAGEPERPSRTSGARSSSTRAWPRRSCPISTSPIRQDPRFRALLSRVAPTRSAARSPIIVDGAWVLPEVIAGMIDASATRRPLDAVDAQLRVDDRERVDRPSCRCRRRCGTWSAAARM